MDTVRYHLAKNEFVRGYETWYIYGETIEEVNRECDVNLNDVIDIGLVNPQPSNAYQTMVMDAGGPSFNPSDIEEEPNPTAAQLYEMLQAADQEIWPGNRYHSKLSTVARLLNIKSEHHISERAYDDIYQLMSELLPSDHVMIDSFYSTKKFVQGLGLPVEKIHCCINGCMIYWGDDSELARCKFCDHPRFRRPRHGSLQQKKNVPFKKMYYFPLTPRL